MLHTHEKSANGQAILDANRTTLSKQCKNLLKAVLEGNKIHKFNAIEYGIGTINSRASDLRKWLMRKI